jgi:hypothetical protein
MNQDRIRYLLHQYAANKATNTEVEEMFTLLKQGQNKEVLKALVTEAKDNAEQDAPVTEEEWGRMWNAITMATFRKPVAGQFRLTWVRMAAAVMVLAVGIAVFFAARQKNNARVAETAKKQMLPNDVPPGGNRAVLTLADGSSIVLDSALNG